MTNKAKHGYEMPFLSDAILDKCKHTLKDRYGVENPDYIPGVREMISDKLRKYNAEVTMSDYSEEYLSLYHDKEASADFFRSLGKQVYLEELASMFNCTIGSVANWVYKNGFGQFIKSHKSKYEEELLSYIGPDFECLRNCRKALDNSELDIYIPSNKLAIEFNGDYWHCDLNKERKYHLNKSLNAQSKGIHLMHIYEHEWKDARMRPILESLIDLNLGRVKNRIYARKCSIKEITNAEAKPFNEANHLQGHRNAKITYGLFYDGKLVQLMSFSPHKKYGWEIIRGCPGSNNIVVGGVSKLFKHFIEENNPASIFSYCDFNKFDGSGYEAIGMKLIGYTGPDKKYLIGNDIVNRNPKKSKLYSKIASGIIWGGGRLKEVFMGKVK